MANRFLRRADAKTIVEKLCAKIIYERKLINHGDRILIAASGGKDSTVLAWALSRLRHVLDMEYELSAIHISNDFDGTGSEIKSVLSELFSGWNIPFTDMDIPVIGRLKAGRKMNCYWCSTQRRGELLKYAVENNYNKIALGHHLDDIIETFFMNMTNTGKLKAMPVLLSYKKYPVSLIRPLGYLEEKQIIECASDLGFLGSTCTCPYGINSGRREIRKKIAEFCDNRSDIKRRILASLSSGSEDLLVDSDIMNDEKFYKEEEVQNDN